MEEFPRLEVDAAAVAEAEVDRGTPAGGMRPHGLEQAPVAEDLIDLPGLGAVLVAVGLAAPLEVIGGPLEPSAILEDRRQRGEGFLAAALFGPSAIAW